VKDIDEARAEVRRVLDADLEALTDGQRLSVVPGVAEDDWELPEPDRRALWSYGLPPARDDELIGVVGDYQSAPEPELEVDGARMYRLGAFGEARLAARPGSGAVLAIPGFTLDGVHPQLRDQFPNGVHPVLVNSGVARLIDFAWRWHWILPVLTEQQLRAGDAEHAAWQNARTPADKAALPDFYDDVRALCVEILERFRQRDAAAVSGDDSLWHEAVMEYL
jgi:hypothetical protein